MPKIISTSAKKILQDLASLVAVLTKVHSVRYIQEAPCDVIRGKGGSKGRVQVAVRV